MPQTWRVARVMHAEQCTALKLLDSPVLSCVAQHIEMLQDKIEKSSVTSRNFQQKHSKFKTLLFARNQLAEIRI